MGMKVMIGRWLGLVALLALAPGCSTGRLTAAREEAHKDIPIGNRVAVLIFHNETAAPEAGRVLAELFTTEMKAHTKLKVSDFSLVAAAMETIEFEAGTLLNVGELGEKLNAQTVITGTVSEYRYRRSLGEAPAVGLTVHVIDVASGKELWTASGYEEGGRILSYRGSLSEIAQKLCLNVVLELDDDL